MASDWQIVRLDDVLRRVDRLEKREDLGEYQFAGTYSFGRGIFLGEKKTGSSFKLDRVQRIHAGDFIYCKIMAWEGAFGLAGKNVDGSVMSGAFVAYEIDDTRIDPRYLEFYFKRRSIWESIGGQSTGTNVRRRSLHPNQFGNSTIPLPPLHEQQRIVARVDAMARRVEEARGVRRAAVGEAEAIEGAISKEFFEIHSSTVPIGRLGDLVTRITKGESPEWQGFNYQETGPIFIRSENVLWGTLDFSKQTHIPTEFHRKLGRSQLHGKDVLINLVGASIGRACVVPDDIGEANVNQAVAVVSPLPQQLDSDYLMHFLISTPTQEIIHGGKVETARPNISLLDLRNLVVPLPSLAEQRSVVAYLDGLQAKVDELRRLQAGTQKELDALMPSILAKAFAGEL